MNQEQQNCQQELERLGLIPRKYHGQVFTSDPAIIDRLIQAIASVHRPGTRIVEIGGGLGYITEKLAEKFDNVDVLEIDEELLEILRGKIGSAGSADVGARLIAPLQIAPRRKKPTLRNQDILTYDPPKEDYLLVGNIPFHLSGRLYRRFMSDLTHKPYGMVFITDKNYAQTLMGQPPRCYRVSLQAQAYGDIEIVADVPPSSVYPEPKVMSCIMKIAQNDVVLPKDFWDVVNEHWANFPTAEVESPKTVGLEGWLKLCKK